MGTGEWVLVHSPICQHHNLELDPDDVMKTCWCLGRWLEESGKPVAGEKGRVDSVVVEEMGDEEKNGVLGFP